ncbi:cellulose binding domain-containing protein, partial [Streptosporangium amethystogenes]|uniref:cellulose binding domain-containing protein n=1 Tax=Streptosporangium amethystogenes TaxID=2002 RepID=UPI001FE1D116
MRIRRTLTAVLAVLGMSLGLSTVAAPAFAASPTAVFTKVSDWGTGFEGKYTITNGGTTTINGWS